MTPRAQVATESYDALLSISLDVAGSTAAKQSVRGFQERYGQHQQQFEAYLKAFCNIEAAFYDGMASARVAELPDLFVVKHIGDEIWCVMPLTLGHKTLSRALIDDVLKALAAMLTRTGIMDFVVTDRVEENPTASPTPTQNSRRSNSE